MDINKQINPRCIADFETCQTLEEALILAMGDRKLNPLSNIYIYPINISDSPFECVFDDLGMCVGAMEVCNRPVIYSYATDNIPLMNLEDCKRSASIINEYLSKKGVENVDLGYQFTFMCAWDNPNENNEIYVNLYLNDRAADYSHEVSELNQAIEGAGGKLTLDIKNRTLTGYVKTYPVKEHIFQKRRIKKANKEIVNTFFSFINRSTRYWECN